MATINDEPAEIFERFFYSIKKAPAAATMATKPWPMAKTLPAPLNDEGVAEAIGLTAAEVVTPEMVPVAIADELLATGKGVAATEETTADEVETGVVEALVAATLLALEVVETWLSVLSPAGEICEVAAVAIDPVARHGKVSIVTG
jgi:hypothetical protein